MIIFVAFLLASVNADSRSLIRSNDPLIKIFKEGAEQMKITMDSVTDNSMALNIAVADTEKNIKNLLNFLEAEVIPNEAIEIEVIDNFIEAKHKLIESRQGLRGLAQTTIKASNDLIFILDEFEKEPEELHLLKIKIEIMKNLVNNTNIELSIARARYNQAFKLMDNVRAIIRIAGETLKKVLEDGDYGKWEFATHPWTILLDILGCLGICSAVADAVDMHQRMARFEDIANSLIVTVGNTDNILQEGLTFLEEELRIIIDWMSNAEKVEGNIERYPPERLQKFKVFRTIFKRGIVALKASAQKFLDQPIDIEF